MPDFTRLKGVSNIGDQQLSTHLESNLVEFLNWGFLCIGAYYNVNLSSINPYGGSPSQLRLCDDRRFAKGKVWEGFRSNWVWENNIEYQYQPIAISGIYINNVFYPTGTSGTYAYNISYPEGRVYFNSPISSTSTVKLEYSYRQYNFMPASVQWFRQLTQRLSRLDDDQFNYYGSGVWSIFGESRVQLPAVVVESVPRRRFKPKALGGGQWCYQDMVFHIFAETPFDRDQMIDILCYQNEKRFFLFDKNVMTASGIFPLTIEGYLSNPNYNYPYLVQNYLWRAVIINNITSQEVENDAPTIYRGLVRMNLEVDFPEL